MPWWCQLWCQWWRFCTSRYCGPVTVSKRSLVNPSTRRGGHGDSSAATSSGSGVPGVVVWPGWVDQWYPTVVWVRALSYTVSPLYFPLWPCRDLLLAMPGPPTGLILPHFASFWPEFRLILTTFWWILTTFWWIFDYFREFSTFYPFSVCIGHHCSECVKPLSNPRGFCQNCQKCHFRTLFIHVSQWSKVSKPLSNPRGFSRKGRKSRKWVKTVIFTFFHFFALFGGVRKCHFWTFSEKWP